MIHTRIGMTKDTQGILSLQEKYLFQNLSDLERRKGFVTTPFTTNQTVSSSQKMKTMSLLPMRLLEVISITLINKINVISEKAHIKKLGWEIIDTFEFNSNSHLGLAFDMKNSVLK